MLKQTLIFFSVLLLLLITEFLLLQSNFRNKFSKEKLLDIIYASSALKDVTTDPCKYSILGEPPLPPNQYLKLNLYCKSGKSINTLDPRAIRTLTYKGVLEEIGRINGFSVEFKNDLPVGWSCLANSSSVKNYNDPVSIPNTITCNYEK